MLQAGDIVAVRKPVLLKGKSRYQGPLVLDCKVAGDIYRVQDLRNKGTDQGLMDVHILQIRTWKPFLDNESDFKDDVNPGRLNVVNQVG